MQIAASLAALALAIVPTRAQFSSGVSFSGTAKSALVGDFVDNECRYDEFSSEFVSAAESRFAFVTDAYWESDLACGRCANVSLAAMGDDDSPVSMPNTTVTVMLISRFEDECTAGSDSVEGDDCDDDLLLSQQAYRDMLNGGTSSRVAVNWKLVNCPEEFVHGGIEFAFDVALSSKLLTVQPRNFQGQISSMEVRFEDGTRVSFDAPLDDSLGSYRMVTVDDGKHDFTMPFTLIAVQAYSGTSIEVEITEMPEAYEVIVTDQQF